MSQLDELRMRQEVAREVAEQRKHGKFDTALLPGGAYRNRGGVGWHDANGNPIAPPPGLDEAGNPVVAEAEPVAEPAPEAEPHVSRHEAVQAAAKAREKSPKAEK